MALRSIFSIFGAITDIKVVPVGKRGFAEVLMKMSMCVILCVCLWVVGGCMSCCVYWWTGSVGLPWRAVSVVGGRVYIMSRVLVGWFYGVALESCIWIK